MEGWLSEQLLELDEGNFVHSSGSAIVAGIENVARRAVALVSGASSHRKSLVIQSLAPSASTEHTWPGRKRLQTTILSNFEPFFSPQGWGSLLVSLILFGCWFYFSTTVARQS